MPLTTTNKHTRRAFLERSAGLAVAGAAAPFAINLAAVGEAAAFNAPDYRALVCVFLNGGSDYAHTVVTYDNDSYAKYAKIRGVSTGADSLVIPRTDLGGTVLKPTIPLAASRQYALHPNMVGLADLFNRGKAAVQLNVGPLVQPLTRSQYQSADRARYPLPPHLFSHNDQQSVWMSSSAEGSTQGWGGLAADLALSSNSSATFTCIAMSPVYGGNTVFLSGKSALSYVTGTSGAVSMGPLNYYGFLNAQSRDLFKTLVQKTSSDIIENEYATIVRRSISAASQLNTGIGGVTISSQFPTTNSLADGLKAVAKLIGARDALGAKRQVFMVQLGGFDLHDGLVAKQPELLKQLSEAITAFYNSTVELGVSDKVTLFTASDFGRALTPNGDGSDHGWGSHHFVVGGAVRGAAFYGTPPPVSVGDTSAPDDQWHVGQGRLLPSTSVDQYAATLASWFGVADSELNGILPNLKNFGNNAVMPGYPINLGFMA